MIRALASLFHRGARRAAGERPDPSPGDYARRNAALIQNTEGFAAYAMLWRAEAEEAYVLGNAPRHNEAKEIERLARELQTRARAFYERWEILD